ncbi:RNA polymerase sigma-70 factor [Puteibacter caeruleilacunae]|nr:RNA polymerase sigma-70 factor [Puteibacter caeruleilacunae]
MTMQNFNQIYTEYYKKSFLFVKSYVHDDIIAEDIVSESLIKLWEKLKESPLDNIKSFLFTILRNATLDHLKHQEVKQKALKDIHKNLNDELQLRLSVLESYDPTDMFSSEIQEIFQKTLKSLPPKTRQVLEMSRFDFKSNKEIAEELDISVKGVEYHISIALKELRKSLSDYLPILFFL